GAGFFLPRTGGDGEGGDEGVLGLARAVGYHVAVVRARGARHRRTGLGERPDLVHLDEDGVGEPVTDPLREYPLVGAEQVVTDQLHSAAQRRRQRLPAGAVVLPAAVLDRDDGIPRAPALVERDQVGRGATRAAGLREHVAVAVGQLAGGTVEREGDVAAGLEAARAERLLEEGERLRAASRARGGTH